jgi:L-ribulokinase
MAQDQFVIGIDFGTDSVRTLIVDAADGKELSSSVFYYPRWKDGNYCDPAKNQFRQHPLDYIEGLEATIHKALASVPKEVVKSIKGISIDTTGSTPVAVHRNGMPLALTAGFEENPNAMFVIWKDHTATSEANEINHLARTWGGLDYTQYEGGVYSSEWFWAKILHVLRIDEKVRAAAYSWAEHCDWIPALLTGNTDPLTWKRSRCAAGHKAMWHESWDGLPSEEFLVKLDPLLTGLRDRLYKDSFTSDVEAGKLSGQWAQRLGLPKEVVVGVGAFDAHMGAVGGEIEPYTLVKIMGTSTCDMLVAPMDEMGHRLVRGICGQVDGSIIPGMLGLEAGQSAFGDVYAWFKRVLMWPLENMAAASPLFDAAAKAKLVQHVEDNVIDWLSREAEKIPIDESDVLALDWMNGRRTPDANQLLKGAITGLSLGSDAPKIFRGLVEATAFGARKIVDHFRSQGVPIRKVIAMGGVAKKSAFIMQVVADVLNMSIQVPRSEQTCALGAAMCAAVASGIYATIEEARQAMGSGFAEEYHPNPANAMKYEALYQKYTRLGEFVERELT